MRHRLATGLVIAAALLSAPLAHAEVPADAPAKSDAAAAEFTALAQEAQAKGTVPLPTDPKAAAVISRLIDPALLGAPPYSANDLKLVDPVVEKARAAYATYIAYVKGAKSATELQTRAVEIQAELLRFSAFFLRAQGVAVPALTDFVAHLKPEEITETRLQGLRRMRAGILQMIQGAGMMSRAGLSADDQAILVNAVADTAAPIAAGLSPEARTQVAAQLSAQFTNLPAPLQARIEAARQAMAITECTGLCKLN